jgi:hypothetical protein
MKMYYWRVQTFFEEKYNHLVVMKLISLLEEITFIKELGRYDPVKIFIAFFTFRLSIIAESTFFQ